MRLCVLLLCLSFVTLAQENPFHTQKNILLFADFLFCEGDYLRASLEYLKLDPDNREPITEYKLALSFEKLKEYDNARNTLSFLLNTNLKTIAALEWNKTFIIEKRLISDSNPFDAINNNEQTLLKNINRLLLTNTDEFSEDQFSHLTEAQKDSLLAYISDIQDPDYKSPVLAGVLSAVIPGAGKIYTGRYTDGIMGFVLTGLMTSLAVINFQDDYEFRGWLFTGLAGWLYAGNIYGSAVSADIHNAVYKAEWEHNFRIYLDSQNYFIPDEVKLCE